MTLEGDRIYSTDRKERYDMEKKQKILKRLKQRKRVYLEVWTGDALGKLFEERYHHFGELCRFYHI